MITPKRQHYSNNALLSLIKMVQHIYITVFPVYQPEKYQLRYAPIKSRITTLAATAPKTAGK
jgi:hypothetical protein